MMRRLWVALLTAGLLSPAALDAATLTRGPYLQMGTPSSVIVRWRTDVATDTRVQWGPAQQALDSVRTLPALTTEHEIAITGLEPDTRYDYAVGSSTETLFGDSTSFVHTAPLPGTARATRVWIIGDSGIPGTAQNLVQGAYRNWAGGRHTDLWLMLGDNAYYSGTDAEYSGAVFAPFASLLRSSVLWPTRGNHEVLSAGPDNDYYEFFSLPTAGEAGGVPSGSEAYYAFDYANIHFVCLDSQGAAITPGAPMVQWLRSDLAATQQDWVIAFWHHPPYTKGSHNSDNATDSEGRMRDMRRYVLPVLDSLGTDLVLCGHSHSYERSCLLAGHYDVSSTLTPAMKVDASPGRLPADGGYHKPSLTHGAQEGTVYAVAGSGCQTGGGSLNHPAMITSLNLLGSMVLDVQGARLDARFIDYVGLERDSFTVLKGDFVGVDPPDPVSSLRLGAHAPNPFRTDVRIEFTLPARGHARLAVHAVDGGRVALLFDRDFIAGTHAVTWNGRDARGRRVPPGVYFTVLESGGETRAHQLVRVR